LSHKLLTQRTNKRNVPQIKTGEMVKVST